MDECRIFQFPFKGTFASTIRGEGVWAKFDRCFHFGNLLHFYGHDRGSIACHLQISWFLVKWDDWRGTVIGTQCSFVDVLVLYIWFCRFLSTAGDHRLSIPFHREWWGTFEKRTIPSKERCHTTDGLDSWTDCRRCGWCFEHYKECMDSGICWQSWFLWGAGRANWPWPYVSTRGWTFR